jgi:outer membrane protein assembly factor BamE (lipoprotein component of BamABCDE complex)
VRGTLRAAAYPKDRRAAISTGSRTFSMKRTARSSLLGAACLALAMAACTPRIDTRGHVATPGTIEKLEVGKQTRDDVIQLLGSPSTTATFDDETWYYISQKTETVAFYAPETIDQKVIALKFDKAGLLKDMQTYTLKDGKAIAMVDRKTPTAGKELTLIEQVFGNVGRFSGGSTPAGPPKAPGTPR